MSKILVSGGLVPTTKDTLLDARTRVATFSEIANIENPARFMVITVEDTGKKYEVKKLTSKIIGGIVVENSTIDINDPEALVDLGLAEELRSEDEKVRQSNENKRIEAENLRKTAEDSRKVNETNRVSAEGVREASERTRVSSEDTRNANEQTRNSNETKRQSQESTRQSQESARQANESTRNTNESARKEAESERKTEETSRRTAELSRSSAENERVKNEQNRTTAENTRSSAEDRRVANETQRAANETARNNAELSREQAEGNRASTFNTLKGQMQTTIQEGQTAVAATEKATSDAQKVVNEYDTKVAEQDSKLTELGSELIDVQYTPINRDNVTFYHRQFVDSRTGLAVYAPTTAEPMMAMSSFVNVDDANKLLLNVIIDPSETSFMGWAFYANANESSYIEGSGDRRYVPNSEYSNSSEVVDVPKGAKYVRFTILEDTERYGDWNLKKNTRLDDIESNINRLSNEFDTNSLIVSKLANLVTTESYTARMEEYNSSYVKAIIDIAEVKETATALLNKELYHVDGVTMYDANEVISGKIEYQASISDFFIPVGTTKLVMELRINQGYGLDSLIQLSVTSVFGKAENAVYKNSAIVLRDGVPTYEYAARNCALQRMVIDGLQGKYIYFNNSECYPWRDTIFTYHDKQGELLAMDKFAANDGLYKEYRRGLFGFAINIPHGCKYIYVKYYDWDGVSETEIVTDLVEYDKLNYSESHPINMWIFGDSISATGFHSSIQPLEAIGNVGGWISVFLEKVRTRPAKVVNYSVGGYTLSDVSGDNSGNSYLKKVDDALKDSLDGTIPIPDIVLIVGCTNDIDQEVKRYVTDEDLNGGNYDDYAENTWFTPSTGISWNTYPLIPLDTINRGKIIGAIRYIVEKIGNEYKDVKFLVVTPPQSTRKTLKEQRGCVRDMIWAAQRLCIPVANVWAEAQMPMLWDYNKDWNSDGLNHRFLDDGVHPYDAGIDDVVVNGYIRQGEYIAKIFNIHF